MTRDEIASALADLISSDEKTAALVSAMGEQGPEPRYTTDEQKRLALYSTSGLIVLRTRRTKCPRPK